jgi:hypothetical protein
VGLLGRGACRYYADTIGLEKVLAGVRSLGMKPAKLLEQCVAQNITLAQWSAAAQKKAASAAAGSKL